MTKFLDPDDARLTAYALGELDAAERADVEQLLATSPELQTELAEIINLAGMLQADLASEPVPALTMQQRQELTLPITSSAVAQPANHSDLVAFRHRRDRRWKTSVAVLAAAIGLTFLTVAPRAFRFSAGMSDHESSLMGQFGENYVPSEEKPVSVSQSWNELHLASTDFCGQTITETEVDLAGSKPVNQNRFPDGNGNGGGAYDANARAGSIDSQSSFSFNAGDGLRFTEAQSAAPRGALAAMPSPVQPTVTLPISNGNDGITPSTSNVPVASYSGATLDQAPFPGIVPTSRRNWNIETKNTPHEVRLADVNNLSTAPLNARFTAENGKGLSESKPTTEQLSVDVLGEKYEAIAENPFLTPAQQPLSTFSIDVDSASYSNIRRFLTQGQLPPPEAVRIEEMINYFNYSYPQPKEGEPFSVIADAAACPWQRDHYLARIALQARTIDKAKRPPTNLVFLLDVSGSMQAANKLPLVKQAMTMLCEELNQRDRIAIVTYAGDAGIKLVSTPGSEQIKIMQVIESLQAGGSTNGAAGINLAYEEALKNFNGEGENRVILCTDGDFNVGVSDDDQLVQLIQQQAKSKVFLSIFGFGMGNLKDAKLEKLADKGNGHYGYIDDLKEARRVFSEELVGTLYTVAKDVKIQVEFNPLTVGAYRLIGYENRALAAKDFNDDTKDAGEIGAGHAVTALYEIVPKGLWPKSQPVDPLKYASADTEPAGRVDQPKPNIPADAADDLFTVKLRYKQPTADTSVRTIDYVVDDIAGKKIVPSADFTWAAAVASFGMQLKHSQFQGKWTLNDLHEAAQAAKGPDANGRRREFLDLVQAAKRLK